MKPPVNFDDAQRRSMEKFARMMAQPTPAQLEEYSGLIALRAGLLIAGAVAAAFLFALWVDHAATKAIGEIIAAQDLGAQW